jgi:hypothetical protein
MKLLTKLTFFYLILISGTLPVIGQSWGAKKPRPIETPKDSLKKGEFTWAPELASNGPILVTVSLDEQLAYTYRNGVLIGMATVSTGKKGHETPTGVFHTTLKDAKHRSSKYNNAPMPYTERFTSSGIALHAGGLPGYPSSHGCVHLPTEYARLLFNAAPLGMTVVVTNKVKSPEFINHPAFLSPVLADGKSQPHERLSENEKFRWTPEKSVDGPVTLLISRKDQRIVVVRNGIEIGRSRITVSNPQDSIGTILFVAHQVSQATAGATSTIGASVKWLAHPLSDANYGSVKPGDPSQQLSRIKIPDDFLQKLNPVIAEGTTMLVTDAPILRNTTGKNLTVLTSGEKS